MNPLVSIIIPTYKRRHKINKAINSLIKQTFLNWEAIVIDNNSNDGTKELIHSYKDDRIKFFQINNKGVISISRNYGINKSTGKYIAFLDSDDWWSPNKLQNVNKAISSGHKFIYHNHYVVKSNLLIKKKYYSRFINNSIYENLLIKGPCFATSSVIVEKNTIIKINLFDENYDLISWEDYDAWLRLAKLNINFHYINKFLSYIKQDDENNLNSRKRIDNIFAIKKKYLDKHNLGLPNWSIIELFKNYSFIKNFIQAEIYFSKIDFSKLKFSIKFKLILLYLINKLKI